jgi:vacuolar-type H+-ATPase subunit E/Vma4
MPRHHNINGNIVPFTAEEEAARDAEEAQAVIDAQARKDAEDAKKARIESAKTKLQDLGLTVDEVKDAFNI